MNKTAIAKFCVAILALGIIAPNTATAAPKVLDNGRVWSIQTGSVNGNGAGIATSGDGKYVYTTDANGVRYSSDFGITWVNRNTGLTDATGGFSDIATSSSGQYLVVIQNGGYLQTSNNFGANWVTIRNVEAAPNYFTDIAGYRKVAMSSTGQYVAIMNQFGNVLYSSTYGNTYVIRSLPQGFGELQDLKMSADGLVLALTDHNNNKIWISQNRGVTWSSPPGLPSAPFIEVVVSGDGQTIGAAINGGDIWTSHDGGANWKMSFAPPDDVNDQRYWTASTSSFDGTNMAFGRSVGSLVTTKDGGVNWEQRPGGGIYAWMGLAASTDGFIMYGLASGQAVFKSLPTWIWTDNSTVTFYLPSCGNSTQNTSVAAAPVTLVADTMSAASNSDGSSYYYFTETDTALFGSNYSYGQQRDALCQISDRSGTVTITRSRFVASNPAFSETTTNTTDFIQMVGNTRMTGINGNNYLGDACGNMTVRHAGTVTQACSSGVLANYSTLTRSNFIEFRDNLLTTGDMSQQSGRAYTMVKIKKSAIAGIPANTSFVATETHTVTSA